MATKKSYKQNLSLYLLWFVKFDVTIFLFYLHSKTTEKDSTGTKINISIHFL